MQENHLLLEASLEGGEGRARPPQPPVPPRPSTHAALHQAHRALLSLVGTEQRRHLKDATRPPFTGSTPTLGAALSSHFQGVHPLTSPQELAWASRDPQSTPVSSPSHWPGFLPGHWMRVCLSLVVLGTKPRPCPRQVLHPGPQRAL